MSLFDDLSSLSERTASEDEGDSDSGPDEVAPPDDSDISAPPSPQLAPSAGPLSRHLCLRTLLHDGPPGSLEGIYRDLRDPEDP
jgi:hypothetical protein